MGSCPDSECILEGSGIKLGTGLACDCAASTNAKQTSMERARCLMILREAMRTTDKRNGDYSLAARGLGLNRELLAVVSSRPERMFGFRTKPFRDGQSTIEANHGLAQRQTSIVGRHQMMGDDLETAFVQLAFRELEKAYILEDPTRQRNGICAGLRLD